MGTNSLNVETANDVREIADLNEEHKEIECFQDEIQSTGDDLEVIENVQEVVSKAANEDGLSPESAKLAEVALESIYKRLGIKHNNIMSLESYGDAGNSRKEITRIACENIKDTIIRVLKAVKEAIAKLWQNIKMFIAKYFESTEMARKEIKRMEDKLAEMKDVEIKPKTVEQKTLCYAFSLDKTANYKSVDSIVNSHIKMISEFSSVGKACKSFIEKMSQIPTTFLEDKYGPLGSETKLKIILMFDKILDTTRRIIFPVPMTVNGQKGWYATQQLVNQQNFGIDTGDRDGTQNGGDPVTDIFNKVSFLTPHVITSTDTIANKIETADKNEIMDLLRKLNIICSGIDKMKSERANIDNFEKDVEALFKNLISNLQKDENNEDINKNISNTISLVKSGANQISILYSKFITMTPKLSLECIRNTLNYISLSVQQEPEASVT